MSGLDHLTAEVTALRKQRDEEAQLREQVVALVGRMEQGAERLQGRLVDVADALFALRAGVQITWSA